MEAKVTLDQDFCKGCDICLELCPKGVFEEAQKISPKGFKPRIIANPENCTGCGRCELLCPEMAISVENRNPRQEIRNITTKAQKDTGRGGWKKIKSILEPRRHFMLGDEACAEGALAAGCRFFAGYPITPASEIMARMLKVKELGGTFIQMEDEIASMAAIIGASWAGKKSITATSGPGFSLMMENLSMAVMTETPCVVVDVQRAGPSTGQATKSAAADLMQARWGWHGDGQIIAMAPASVDEAYKLTIRAFNLAERFRVPVIILMDEIIGHLEETFLVEEELSIFDRIYRPGEPPFGPTKNAQVTSMPNFEDQGILAICSSTHNSRGKRMGTDPEIQEKLLEYLENKILKAKREICDTEEVEIADAETIIVAYGSAARTAKYALKKVRQMGLKVGLIRPKVVWPFPDETFKKLGKSKRFVVIEMNRGQMVHLVREYAMGEVVSLVQTNGLAIDPRRLIEYLTKGRWQK